MFMQLLLPLAIATLFFFLWLVLRRRDARAQARDDFTRFMTTINDWSANATDYQLTARAVTALEAHKDRLLLSEHTLKPRWIGSSGRRHYLAEYQLCQTRHSKLLMAHAEHAAEAAQANELEQAIQALTKHTNQELPDCTLR